MMKPRTLTVGLLVVVVAAITVAYTWPRKSFHRDAESANKEALGANPAIASTEEVRGSGSSAKVVATKEGGSRDANRTLYEKATNYWTYAHSVLPAAASGDADAQYFLSKVLEWCEQENRMYFRRKGRVLALDEGLRWAGQRHLPLEVAQSVHEKCQDFLERDASDLGTTAAWLAKATAAGQPMAQAATALKLLIQEMLDDAVRAGAVPTISEESRIVGTVSPRELLRAAVESKEPEVLFTIGNLQALLSPDNADESTERYAWWVVACERGFDCSPKAEWVQIGCVSFPGCEATGGPAEVVRSIAGERWSDVQQRAQEISTRLDSGQWDQLGLGP